MEKGVIDANSLETGTDTSGDFISYEENASYDPTSIQGADTTHCKNEKETNDDARNKGMEQLSDEERKMINLILNSVKNTNLKNVEIRHILSALSKGNLKTLNKDPKHIKKAATFLEALLQWQDVKAKKMLEIFEKYLKINRLSFEEIEDLNEQKKSNAMKYQLSDGYVTVSGVFYTIILAKLLGFLALTQGYEFQIALEYKPGGKFDDLCFMLRKKNSSDEYQNYHFQLKRKEKITTITIENDLFPCPNKTKKVKYDGPYNLYKYFENSKQNLQNDTLLVLFSNAELINVNESSSLPLFPLILPQNTLLNYHKLDLANEERFKNTLLTEFPDDDTSINLFIKQLRLALGQPNYDSLRKILRKLLHEKFGYEYETAYNLLSIHLFTSLSKKNAVASCHNTIKEVICKHISGHNGFYKQLYSRTNILTQEKGIDTDSLNFSQEKTMLLRLKKKQKLSKIDVAIIGPAGSGKNELLQSYLSRMENVIQFKHIICLDAESEETLHISLCEIAAMYMLNTEWRSEIAWDKKQMEIDDILNALYNFVNNGKVLFIFQNAASFLKPSNSSIGIYRYLDHFKVSVNFFYIITSSEIISGKHPSYIYTENSKESNAKLYLENLVQSSSSVEIFINLDVKKVCETLKYNLIAIRLFLGLAEETKMNPMDILNNISAETNVIDYLLEEIVTHLSKTYDINIIQDTLTLLAVLYSRKLSMRLLKHSFLEENDKIMHENILKCLSRMKVFEIDVEEYISIHPVIQNNILKKQIDLQILEIYKRLVNIWSLNPEETSFLGGIQHVLRIWKSIVSIGLREFDEEKVCILAHKISLVLRDSYNKELYESFCNATLQKLNKLQWNKYISLCWLQKADYKIETNINDTCIEEILQKVEEVDELCSTKVKILDLKYHVLKKNREITKNRIQTLIRELEHTEKEFSIYDIQMFLEICVHYYLTTASMGLDNEKVSCLRIFEKYKANLKNMNNSITVINKIKTTLSNSNTDYNDLKNVFHEDNFVLDTEHSKINMVFGYVKAFASSIFLGSRFEKLEKFSNAILQKFGAFHPMVIAINDKMVRVKLLDEDRKGALQIVQNQKEQVNTTLKKNNYPDYKKHYLLLRIKHNIKQLETQNSSIRYLKNLEKSFGKEHPEYKRYSVKINEFVYTTAHPLPNEEPQNDDTELQSGAVHPTPKYERNYWLKVKEHDLCHPMYDELKFQEKLKKTPTDVYDKWQDNDEDTPLHKAAREGNLDEIIKLLRQGTDVNTRNHEGETALHKACIHDKIEIVRHLIECAKANINCIDKLDETPLHKTAFLGRFNIMKYLINKKADINCKNREGKTLLHKAASASNCNIIAYLISYGVNVNCFDHLDNTPLHDAMRICQLDVVKCLIINGAAVNYQNKNRGETALHKAVTTGCLDVVKYLVEEANVDVNIKNIFGRTALNIAKSESMLDVVSFLTYNCQT